MVTTNFGHIYDGYVTNRKSERLISENSPIKQKNHTNQEISKQSKYIIYGILKAKL